MASDLLSSAAPTDYDASSIEVLEGLEPVRKRPGMYIGGTDERALHHLVAEVLDNSMDEAVAGYANRIDVELHADYSITIRDNGRGIPIDPHPKFPDKSALEVILCTLHAGGKFSGKAYQTSGGLHGVGASVVNALSDRMVVQVARNKELYEQKFSRGLPLGPIQKIGAAPNRRGTNVTFHADPEIFGSLKFKPARLFKSMRSKAYLFTLFFTDVLERCVIFICQLVVKDSIPMKKSSPSAILACQSYWNATLCKAGIGQRFGKSPVSINFSICHFLSIIHHFFNTRIYFKSFRDVLKFFV